ncbi:hypothetical protein BDW02DRAFT_318933 [Decorospora gaudefroyi]|uniref:Uncharacterized protein n=1 Tax=Decorospora gaudefroyi TaxID=184978 RepID=A0A6A5KF31_9PLEO|nr:hypothetical protein BDW02DRAFT_318933 [Decorospora gaudefroyi]
MPLTSFASLVMHTGPPPLPPIVEPLPRLLFFVSVGSVLELSGMNVNPRPASEVCLWPILHVAGEADAANAGSHSDKLFRALVIRVCLMVYVLLPSCKAASRRY